MLITRKKKLLEGANLDEKISELQQYYRPVNLNPSFKANKIKAMKRTKHILSHTTKENLQKSSYHELLRCSLTLIYYFGMKLKIEKPGNRCSNWYSQWQFKRSERLFHKTLEKLLPEQSDDAIRVTLGFITETSLWPYESFVQQLFEVLLYYNQGKSALYHLLLTDIHCVLFTDVVSARHRTRVLYELLQSENWIMDRQKLLPLIIRFLNFFAYSISKGDGQFCAYRYLRKGFQVCLQRIFERAENNHKLTIIATMLNWFYVVNLSDDDVFEFSSLLDYAARLYKVNMYSESFCEGLFDHVLKNLVASPSALYSLVGSRLVVRFLDRQINAQYLAVPAIYYDFSQVELKIGVYDSGDKAFIRQYREKFHKYFLEAVKRHCYSAVNLKAIFTAICCIVLEHRVISSPLSAAVDSSVESVVTSGISGPKQLRVFQEENLFLHKTATLLLFLWCCVRARDAVINSHQACHMLDFPFLKKRNAIVKNHYKVPCGLTAAVAACMAMVIQDYAINAEHVPLRCRYWMHAIVVSVMSLVCWVHRAPDLYRYVNRIVSIRAKEAPQLNPPLTKIYNVQKHIMWNKPTLYFEDWELRYGLWKHFQGTPKPSIKSDQKIKLKPPFMHARS